jgi:hypothetical protein
MEFSDTTGKHINYTVRSQFDPARRVEQEFKVKES